MPGSVKKKQVRDPVATRGRILAAGEQLFSESGYTGVSVDAIAQVSGANKRMVYHYFGNKEGLYVAVLREVFGRLEGLEVTSLSEATDVETGVTTLLRIYFEFLREHPEFVNLLMWENLNRGRFLEQHPNLLTKIPVLRGLEALLRKGREAGSIRPGVNTRHLLVFLYSICFVYHANRFTMRHTVGIDLGDEAVRREGIQQAAELLLHGLVVNGK